MDTHAAWLPVEAILVPLAGGFMHDFASEIRRIFLPRILVNRGAVAARPRLLLLFEQQLLLCQSASAAHTALTSARRKASKTPGAPWTGLSCSLTDTVTERLPFGLAARN